MNRVEYELFYLVGESKETDLAAIRETVEGIVKKFGGEFLPAETSEKRTMAYEIRKEKRGTYVARRFTLPGAGDESLADMKQPVINAIDEINRELKLATDVLRSLILRADTLPALAPIAREEYPKSDRRDSDRGRRGGMAPKAPAVRGGAPTEQELLQVPEKKKPEVEEPKSELSKEEIDKKLDEVLGGIE